MNYSRRYVTTMIKALYDEGLKVCPSCFDVKNIEDFHPTSAPSVVPLMPICKECNRLNCLEEYKNRIKRRMSPIRKHSVIYKFVHKELGVFKGTRQEFEEKYKFKFYHIAEIMRGKRKMYKDWKVIYLRNDKME